jgi:hypothetical protein
MQDLLIALMMAAASTSETSVIILALRFSQLELNVKLQLSGIRRVKC